MEDTGLETKLAQTEAELHATLEVNARLVLEIERLTGDAPAGKKEHPAGNIKEYRFTHNTDEYGFNFWKIKYHGTDITPVEICADADIQNDLVTKKSGMIFKLNS